MAASRRQFIRTSASIMAAGLAAGAALGEEAKPAEKTAAPAAAGKEAAAKPVEKPAEKAATTPATTQALPKIAVIGCGGMTRYHARFLHKYAELVGIADVDRQHLEAYNKDFAGGKAFIDQDYRKVLARPEVELVMIGTPDHWHTRILIDALRAGKDVYCEKPLTLTIDEGRLINRVVRETGRIVQVGTQQRSQEVFLTAIALAHAGRLGRIRQVSVSVGDTPRGGDFQPSQPPAELDWEDWQGQTPKTQYIKERSHFNFRWWYEYSGGIVTDWGAHHVDIAQWAVAPDLPGPKTIEPLEGDLPVRFERGYPVVNNTFNTATHFNVKCTFANGVELFLRDRVPGFTSPEGILIEGDGGYLMVTRTSLTGTAVDAMKDQPLPAGMVRPLPPGLEPHERHVLNFVESVKTRQTPASDVWSHNKHLTTCHLVNIALRLGRPIRWDASAQEIVGDAEADAFQSRAQRRGFEIA